MNEHEKKLTITFMGGRQAGAIGLLTLLAAKCEIACVVAYDKVVSDLAHSFGIPTVESIKTKKFIDALNSSDLLVCVHGREIVPSSILKMPRLGSINVHPCLYKYKGADPIGRLLKKKNSMASVGIHYMTDVIDGGKVIAENYIRVDGLTTTEAVYNALYPVYASVLLEVIKRFEKESR